jgi:hypothetical protein
MSELHPDADLVKVTRTTTTYEAADPRKTTTDRQVKKGRNRRLSWVIGICAALAIIGVVGVMYYDAHNTSAVVQQSALAEDQGRAQALSRQADAAQRTAQSAQQSADRSAADARTLADNAAQDRAAAKRAAIRANDAGKDVGPATN